MKMLNQQNIYYNEECCGEGKFNVVWGINSGLTLYCNSNIK